LPRLLRSFVSLVARYDIDCPCGETISLLEKTLRRIIANLQESNRGARKITFVCWRCKIAFRFDYQNRRPAEEFDEPLHSSEPSVCVVRGKCGVPGCASPVELVVVAKSGTSAEQFRAEVRTQDWTTFVCERAHPLRYDISLGELPTEPPC